MPRLLAVMTKAFTRACPQCACRECKPALSEWKILIKIRMTNMRGVCSVQCITFMPLSSVNTGQVNTRDLPSSSSATSVSHICVAGLAARVCLDRV